MRTGVLLSVAALLVAGCLGGDADRAAGPNGPPDPPVEVPALAIEAPASWAVGRHWTYEGAGLGASTYVVTDDAGSTWMMETSDPDLAFFDAEDDLSWLGPIRKSDLAGTEEGQVVEYFRFPLEPGKTWTTPWDGTTMTVTVTGVVDGVATLEAVRETGLWVRYTYDASIEWFGDRVFFDEAGSEVFALSHARDGFGFTGNIARWTLETAVEADGPIDAQPETWHETFDVPEGITDLWMEFDAVCPSGIVRLEIAGVEQPLHLTYGNQCPTQFESQQVLVEVPKPGRWEVGFLAESPQGEGEYDVTILLRTLELTGFG